MRPFEAGSAGYGSIRYAACAVCASPLSKYSETRIDSSAANLLGRSIVGIDNESGDLLVDYVANVEFTNRHGTVAGGFLAAMLDSLTALAGIEAVGPTASVVTKDLHVSFERPASAGRLRGSARIESRDRASLFTSGELTDEEGVVVARASAELRILCR